LGSSFAAEQPDRADAVAVVDEEIVLLHGFIKKQQKTPQEELGLAKKRRKQYLEKI
jgi:phage-related protein